jgi:hypothetical protein
MPSNNDWQRSASLFFGQHRYILKRLLKSRRSRTNTVVKNNSTSHRQSLLVGIDHRWLHCHEPSCQSSSIDRAVPSTWKLRHAHVVTTTNEYHQLLVRRCACLTTIIRNLSFIVDNVHLANDHRLLDILQRILNCHHDRMHSIYDCVLSIDDEVGSSQQRTTLLHATNPDSRTIEIELTTTTNNKNCSIYSIIRLSHYRIYRTTLTCVNVQH